MPQKPQVRAKNKRRLTRRLAKWRAAKEGSSQPQGVSTPSATAAEKKAS
ncbi:MAG TPA: hypothetical protein VK459_21810 [Polyangiaceae bacterium]|nr:hypothetical protein [Polyangiaceae bacterium]